jgi:NADH-ubiquinone oxidoreductase chain 5
MIFACGVSAYDVSFFHLMNHAFFKALLFLASGIIIHGLNNEQDIRKMGGLIQLLPYSYSMILIGSLSLAGFPFLSGFYSKDMILEIICCKIKGYEVLSYFMASISTFLTSFYSGRLLWLVFTGESRSSKILIQKFHEGSYILATPLGFLVIGAIFSGYFLKDMLIGVGSIFFSHSIFILESNFLHFDLEFLPLKIKLLPTILSLTGFIISFFIFFKPNFLITSFYFTKIYVFLNMR